MKEKSKEVCWAIFWLFLVIFIFYAKHIFGIRYTGWDTHDIGFVNFLYMVDCLHGGYLPFWNPLIQSGTFFPSLNNIGLFSPFQMAFVLFAQVLNPVYVYELYNQFILLFGGFGAYLFFRFTHINKYVSLFGAVTYLLVVLIPIIGQNGIAVSLGVIPWLLIAVIYFTFHGQRKSVFLGIFCGVLAGFYLSCGYPWLNGVVFAMAWGYLFVMTVDRQKSEIYPRSLFPVFLFFISILLTYMILLLPGYIDIKFNWAQFTSYTSPDPRLRGVMGPLGLFSYQHFSSLFLLIDPRIMTNSKQMYWSTGVGWVVVILFVGRFFDGIRFKIQELYWLMLGLLAILYTFGKPTFFLNWISHIPFINANRWLLLGACLVSVFMIFLVTIGLNSFLLKRNKRAQLGCISLLIFINLVSFYTLYHPIFSGMYRVPRPPYALNTGGKEYFSKVAKRKKDINIENNFRRLGLRKEYIWNDDQWGLEKIPFSHGYNNLGNPLYWYVKDQTFLSQIVSVKQRVCQETTIVGAKNTSSDDYVRSVVRDITSDTSRPTVPLNDYHQLIPQEHFQYSIQNFSLTPNRLTFTVTLSYPAYLIFYSNYHPAWHVSVDKEEASLIRMNHLFMGVFINMPGKHEVEFFFRPLLMYLCLFLPYSMLFLFGIILIFMKIKEHIRKNS